MAPTNSKTPDGTSTEQGVGDVVPESYIVTLHPNLAQDKYEKHMVFVQSLCDRYPLLSDRKTACVTRVMTVPRDSPSPKELTYFGNFNKEIAQKIAEEDREMVSSQLCAAREKWRLLTGA